MSFRGWLLVIGVAAVAAIVQVPATLLVAPIEASCGGRCRLAAVEGSLWRGAADLWLRQGQARSWQDWQPAARFSWRLDAGALWQGRLALVVGQEMAGNAAARLEAGLGGVAVDIGRLSLPAGPLLAGLGEGMPTAGWGGHLVAENCTLRRDLAGRWRGEGALRWLGARTSLLENLALGDYRLAWRKPLDGPATGELTTERGDLALQGDLTVNDRGPRFAGTAEARNTQRARLEKYLRAVGAPLPGTPGRYRLRLPDAPAE